MRFLYGTRTAAGRALVTSVAAACTASCVHEPRPTPGAAMQCVVQEESRQQLRLDAKRSMYVEPEVLSAATNGEVLLAGTPSYVWTTGSDGIRRGEQGRVLGVVLPDTGYAREVSAPVDATRIRTVRAATQADGSWAVVFVETVSAETDSVAHLWFGVHDGRDWRRLEHIPVPPDGRLRAGTVSRLAHGGGDTLAFAIPIHVASSHDAAVFTFDGHRWRHEIVPTGSAAYAEPSFAGGRWVMALVRPDTTLPSDGNSLFLYAKEAQGWRVLWKVAPGRAAPIHEPVLRLDADNGGVLGWRALVTDPDGQQRWEARVARGPLDGPVAAAPIDSAAEGLISVVLPESRAVWLTDHRGPDGNSIRFFTRGRVRMEEIGRVPSSYEGFFGAAALPDGRIMISGPLVERSGETLASLTSQLIRAVVQCAPAAPGHRVGRTDARPRPFTSLARDR